MNAILSIKIITLVFLVFHSFKTKATILSSTYLQLHNDEKHQWEFIESTFVLNIRQCSAKCLRKAECSAFSLDKIDVHQTDPSNSPSFNHNCSILQITEANNSLTKSNVTNHGSIYLLIRDLPEKANTGSNVSGASQNDITSTLCNLNLNDYPNTALPCDVKSALYNNYTKNPIIFCPENVKQFYELSADKLDSVEYQYPMSQLSGLKAGKIRVAFNLQSNDIMIQSDKSDWLCFTFDGKMRTFSNNENCVAPSQIREKSFEFGTSVEGGKIFLFDASHYYTIIDKSEFYTNHPKTQGTSKSKENQKKEKKKKGNNGNGVGNKKDEGDEADNGSKKNNGSKEKKSKKKSHERSGENSENEDSTTAYETEKCSSTSPPVLVAGEQIGNVIFLFKDNKGYKIPIN